MKGYVFICEKQSSVNVSKKEIEEILSTYNSIEGIQVKESKRLNLGLFTFSNENHDINYSYGPIEFATSGDFLYNESMIFEEFLNAENRNEYMAKIGGINTLAVLDGESFKAWNNVTRVEPIYWSETKERIVVGTKALLVHLLTYGSRTPIYDIHSTFSFLNNGFYADEKSPYENLNILESNRCIKVTDKKVEISPIDDFEEKLYSLTPLKEDYDDLAEAYLNSFLFIKKMNIQLNTGLTGGKDSRMVVAALSHLGIDFQAQTTGFKTTPDVVVAQMIAEKLSIPHKYQQPSAGKSHVNTDLFLRTVNTIKNTEGLLYSYENVAGSNKLFNPNKMMFGGQGGENLRGGYARKHQFSDKAHVERFMLNAFMKYKDYFVGDEIEKYTQFIKDFIYIKSSHLKANDILNHFFLKYRTGRWSSSSRSFYTSVSPAYSPLFENQLVKKAQIIDTIYGASDDILYNILQRIAPELIDIPFADDRWGFESQHPYHKYTLAQWINRKPIQAVSKQSSFNWRKNVLLTSKQQFEDVILGSENSALFDIVNKDKLKTLFTSKVKNPARYDALLWSLYTGSILLSNSWYQKTNSRSRISIKVPEKTNVRVPGIIDEIRHLPNSILNSRHKDLNVQAIDDVTSIVKWKTFDSSVMYFQTFDGNFTKAPSFEYKKYSKVKGKKARFVFEIEKVLPNNFELDVYFIQYQNEKRIKSEMKKYYIAKSKDFYQFEIPILAQSTDYKIAFRVNKIDLENQFMINQMRIEFLT